MALETASYVSQLIAANPLSTDLVSQTDDHLRLIKAALVNTFPNLNAPVTSTPDQLNNPVPKGAIILWSGASTAIPLGYGLCDGTNGTPDLRARFVVGAGSTYNVNDTGGSVNTGMGGTHTHTINNAGAHTHGGQTGSVQLTAAQLPTAAGAGSGVATAAGLGTASGHAHTISSDGDHAHTVNQVGDHQHSCLPPYLALCYIMKL
jgi:hypothetical protein